VAFVATAVIAVAVLGPLLAPHPPSAPVGPPYAPPGASALLGTDFLGRDVLSRLLSGGRSVVLLASLSMVVAYLIGGAIGLTAGLSRSALDDVLMRPLDVVVALPPFLVLAVLATGAGRGLLVVLAAVALANLPGVARVVRTATLEVSTKGYVEAAVARGEPPWAIALRDVLPNIAAPLVADFGVRFTAAAGLVASANFLGLGVGPPAADWALMIAENRTGIALQPWAVAAPAAMIGLLTVAVNLSGDELARRLGPPATSRSRP
jgi:ABC-type dipeptide/oligopeptide/nickel transport system permease subunit